MIFKCLRAIYNVFGNSNKLLTAHVYSNLIQQKGTKRFDDESTIIMK